MESTWWLVGVIVLVAGLGVLVLALMIMVIREDRRAVKAEQASVSATADPATLGAYWG